MEVTGEQDHFKYIPFRCYVEDGYKQKLVRPSHENGQKKTLQDLLNEMFPENSDSKL